MPNNLEKPTTSEIELPDDLVHIEGGTFQMGSDNGYESEKPVHQVTLSDFYISQYPITVKQYRLFCDGTHKKMPKKPSWGWKDDHPIINVCWNDAKAYCEWKNGRLPTEAEWEFAARGGNKSIGYKYSGGDQVKKVAWYKDNTNQTYIVGKKQPNELNLFDMSGNVWEWCMDDWSDHYREEPQSNPQSSTESNECVRRGGSWRSGDYQLRVTNRRGENPECNYGDDVGFRLVKVKVAEKILEEPPEIPPIEPEPSPEKGNSTLEKQIAELEKQWKQLNQKLYHLESEIQKQETHAKEIKQETSIKKKIHAMRKERFAALEEQWKLLNELRSRLEREKIYENRAEEIFRLEALINDIHKDCEKKEQEMSELETQLRI